ncbi:MAG TPA: hypothetical protein VEY30_06745 [Myxococcaceae bacterium]|nr:hypothetical protein [Myxococcaceae bacterium]
MITVRDVRRRQGAVMGTVILELSDDQNDIREVWFRVQQGTAGPLGPFPPDIVRRPNPEVYEIERAGAGCRTATTVRQSEEGPHPVQHPGRGASFVSPELDRS